ncbi:MAG: hypothetical protein WKH64_18735, partial [Chloroflexia bacterium]
APEVTQGLKARFERTAGQEVDLEISTRPEFAYGYSQVGSTLMALNYNPIRGSVYLELSMQGTLTTGQRRLGEFYLTLESFNGVDAVIDP